MAYDNGRRRPETEALKSSKMALVSPGIVALGALSLLVAGLLAWLLLASPAKLADTPAEPSAVGGPFHMIDQNGRPVDQSILQGRWNAVFFGYVSCPDICPATLQTLSAAERRMGADAERLQVVFISVDPARDTPAQLKAWLDQPGFPPQVVALTGTEAQVAATAKAYKVFYQRETGVKDYKVAHSAAIYLMDPKGRFVGPLVYDQGPDKIAAQIKTAMHSN